MDKYRILAVIGEGTYGKVFKAQEKETGRVVAIKKFKQAEDEDPHVRKTMMREIKVLKEFRHQNIVNLRKVFRENGKLYLVFDYVQKTLLEELQSTPNGLPLKQMKEITYQILTANNFLHEKQIMHRDIKPENLLISKNGVVKLCDFGFARPMKSEATYQYTDYVSTRWYRAPELLVGDAAYSGTVDVWAIGCIFAEIFNGMPLFPGDSDLHTLQLILETITADDMQEEKPLQELSKKQRVAFRLNPLFDGLAVPTAKNAIQSQETANEVSLKALLKDIDENCLDFIRKCLVIDGSARSTMSELLEHPLFDEEFRNGLKEKLEEWDKLDEEGQVEMSKEKLLTKDGKEELGEAELLTQESKKDDEVDEDDDDSSSAICSPNGSSGSTPISSSGVDRPPLSQDHGTAERTSKVPSNNETKSVALAQLNTSAREQSNPTQTKNDNGASPASWSNDDSNDSINKEAQQIEEKLAQANTGSKCLLLSSKNLDAEQNPSPRLNEENKETQLEKEVKDLKSSHEKLQSLSQDGQNTQPQGGVTTAEPSEAESNPTNLQMLQTPIKYEQDGSPSEDYNPANDLKSTANKGYENQNANDIITQQQKRSSFHQFNKIEGTITEEIKEEAAEGSDRSSGPQPVSVEMKESLNQIFPQRQVPTETHTTEQSEYLAAVDIGSIDANSMQKTLTKPETQGDLVQIKASVPLQGGKLHSETHVTQVQTEIKKNSVIIKSEIVTQDLARQESGSATKRSKSEKQANSVDKNYDNTAPSPPSMANSIQGSSSSLAQLVQPHQESSHRVNQSKGSTANKISKVNITFVNEQQSDRKNSLLALQANAIATQGQNPSSRVEKTSILATSINQSGQNSLQIHNHIHSLPHSQNNSLTRTFHHQNQSKSSSRGQIIQRNSISLQQNPSKINQLQQQHTARCEEQTPKKPGSINMAINQNTFIQPGSFKGPQVIQMVVSSNNNTAQFGVEGNSMAKMKGINQQNLLNQKQNGTLYSNSIQPNITGQNSQFTTQKPVYNMMKYPQTQVKSQSYKQQAVMKQTASMEKLDRGFTPQKLPNLKAVQSSMSQYSKMEESKMGEGLLPKNANTQSKQGLHFSQQRKEPAHKLTESNTSINKMNFTHQNYHRPTQSNTSDFKQIPNRANHPGVTIHSHGQPQQVVHSKLVSFPKLSEGDQRPENPQSTYINKGNSSNQPQRYPDGKHQKFVNVAQADQASITASSAFAEHSLGTNNNQNVTIGKNFQPSMTNEYMLSKESLLEASRPSLHNNSHYMEGVKQNQMPNQVNQLAIHGQAKSQSNNQSFHSTMQQNKNNKFVEQKFNKQSGSGGLVMGRRQQNQNVSTSNMTLAKSIVAIGGDSFEFGNQLVQPIGTTYKQTAHSEVKSQPTGNSTSKQQQSQMNSLFTKGKFFQSHQLSHGSHYGNQPTSTAGSPGSSNQAPPPSSLSNFEKDNSFPRRNITNKLKNAGNLQYQRKNQRDQMGPSPSPMNASGKQGGQIMLPNLQSGASNQTLNNLLQSNDQQRQSKISLSPNIKPVIEHSPNIGGSKKFTQPNKNGVVQLNASEFNLKLSGTNNGTGQHIVRKPPHVIQRSNQRQQQYQMYLTPSQNYTSGNTTGMVRGASHQAHKNVGSTDSMLKKMSVENPSLNTNGPKSPMNNVQFKVKTETNWNKGNQQIFDNPSQNKNQNQLYRMNNQVVEKSISPERIQQAMKRSSGISQPVKSPNLLKHKLRQNPQQFI